MDGVVCTSTGMQRRGLCKSSAFVCVWRARMGEAAPRRDGAGAGRGEGYATSQEEMGHTGAGAFGIVAWVLAEVGAAQNCRRLGRGNGANGT